MSAARRAPRLPLFPVPRALRSASQSSPPRLLVPVRISCDLQRHGEHKGEHMSGTGADAPHDGSPRAGGGDPRHRSQGPELSGGQYVGQPGSQPSGQPGSQPSGQPGGRPGGRPGGLPGSAPQHSAQGTDPDATHRAWGPGQPHPNAPTSSGPGPAQRPGGQSGYSAQSGPGSPLGPGYAQDPGSPQGPVGPIGSQHPGRQPSSARRWALIVAAFGCIVLLLLVVGGGILYLTLQRSGGADSPTSVPSDPESTSETTLSTDPADSKFVGISPLDTPPGDADDLRGIMANNPLTTGTMPAVGSCEIPETPVEQTVEELQATLVAANTCLNSMWSSAAADRGLPWDPPSVQVYTYPDIPSSPCEPDTFEKDFPRVCNLDFTIYWPAGYGTGAEQSDPAAVPGAYVWDLSYLYMNTVSWNSSLTFYYGALADKLEGDEEQSTETWRRYNLQMRCLAAASTMQMPAAAQPTPEQIETLLDESTWPTEDGPKALDPASRVRWIQVGLESGGDLAQCNTWLAPADQVA